MAPQAFSNGTRNGGDILKDNVHDGSSSSSSSDTSNSSSSSSSSSNGGRLLPDPTNNNNNNNEKEIIRTLRQELQSANAELESLRRQSQPQQQQQRTTTTTMYELEDVNVIINLQDELQACQQVMYQQKEQIQRLISSSLCVVQSQAPPVVPPPPTAFAAKVGQQEQDEQEEEESYKMKWTILQDRYSELQNNRVWAEFQLRNRITKDSLKYHRRLIHWKRENEQLRDELTIVQKQHEQTVQELQTKWKSTATSVLQHTLRDLKLSQDKVKQLEKEVTKLKQQLKQQDNDDDDEHEMVHPATQSSSKYLVRAARNSTFLN